MYAYPRTPRQRAENADDAAADMNQDIIDNPDPRSREEIDNDYWNDIRLKNIELGMSPDEADLKILMLRGGVIRN